MFKFLEPTKAIAFRYFPLALGHSGWLSVQQLHRNYLFISLSESECNESLLCPDSLYFLMKILNTSIKYFDFFSSLCNRILAQTIMDV